MVGRLVMFGERKGKGDQAFKGNPDTSGWNRRPPP